MSHYVGMPQGKVNPDSVLQRAVVAMISQSWREGWMVVKILKVLVIGIEAGSISKCDAIEYDGKLWLVPRWLDSPAEGVTRPARLVRFDTNRHQATPNSPHNVDYVLNVPVPRELFDVRTPPAIPGYEFLELPDLQFPLIDKTKN
jgi:hypothetical protein